MRWPMYWTTKLLAAASSVSTTTTSYLPELPIAAQYGFLGAGFAALASGKLLVPRYVLDRERERNDRLEAENQRLQVVIQEKAIPAVIEGANAVRDSAELVREFQRERDIEREVKERTWRKQQ